MTPPAESDRDRWDARHMAADDVDPAPARFLVESAARLPTPTSTTARALDLACGRGRNAVWLARRGFTVDAVDVSTIALAKAQSLAARNGVAERVCTIECDLKDGIPAIETAYDVVLCLHFRIPERWQELSGFVAPGGALLVETLARHPSNLDVNPDFLGERDELLVAAGDLEVLVHSRAVVGRRAVDRLLARRP